jgi:hypothetical protein
VEKQPTNQKQPTYSAETYPHRVANLPKGWQPLAESLIKQRESQHPFEKRKEKTLF